MKRMAYGNNVFVAVGQDYNFGVGAWQGSIIRSTNNGQTWNSVLSGEANVFRSVAFANGTFVAVGEGGMIYTSSDGQSWTSRSNPAPASMVLESIAYGNGVFVVVGTSAVYRSTDSGTTWTSIPAPNFFSRKVIHDGTQFVILTSYTTTQDLITSPDGTTWTYEQTDIEVLSNDIVGSDGLYQIVGTWSGANTNAVSLNRVAWFTDPSHSPTEEQRGLGIANGRLFSVGDNGSIYELTTFSVGAPMITAQPLDNAALAGESITTTVSATGNAPLSYQWYEGETGDEAQPVAGQTSETLSINAPATPTAYWVKVSNAEGNASSTTAWLRTHQLPMIGAIANQTVPFNGSASSVSISISDDLTPVNALDLTVSSSSPGVVDGTKISVATVNGNAELTLTPQMNVSGQATITLYVTDEHGACQHITFLVTVSPHTAADPVIFHTGSRHHALHQRQILALP